MKKIFFLSVAILFFGNIGYTQSIKATSTTEDKIEKNPFASPIQVIPNPSQEKFILNFNKEIENYTVQIYNHSGKLVYNQEVKGEKQHEVETSNFIKGNYHLFVINNEESFMEKLIIE